MLTVEEIKARIRPLCREYGIKRAFLFGSYARGNSTEASDVDIRIEKLEGCDQLNRKESSGLFRKNAFMMGGFLSALEAALNIKVDLISDIPWRT